MGRQQPAAEPVDRADPGALRVAGEPPQLPRALGVVLGVRPSGKLAANPGAKLARRLLGEREGEDALDARAVLGHCVAIALYEHARLAGPRPRDEEYVAVAGRDGRR